MNMGKIEKRNSYDSHIWGPPFWFVLHTIAMNYPDRANEVTRRKYYDFVQNLPLFIPNAKMGDEFSQLLDKYPITPYLDKRESFIRWTVFIHNKINKILGKPELELSDAIDKYNAAYIPEKLALYGDTSIRKNIVYVYSAIFLVLCLILYIMWD
jgi:hypothetical protein